MPRRSYSGSARPTRLNLSISTTDDSFTLTDPEGWPTGANGPFFMVIDRGKTNEEKILALSRIGNTIAVAQRGADGTSPFAHGVDAFCEHVWTSTDSDESNAHVNSVGLVHGVSSQMVGVDDVQRLTNKTIDAGENTITGLTVADIALLTEEQAAQDAATAQVQANLDFEAQARIQSDQTLNGAVNQNRSDIIVEAQARAAADALLLPKAGGSVTGSLSVGGALAVTGAASVGAATLDGHAATKGYVDQQNAAQPSILYGTGAPPTSGFKTGDLYLRYV